ncbi:hypothetical protein AVEN_267494-1 [Araneus ventricosus]|uniref:Uncharacterized protein n=1 Tax=Araneus ventricosus TaxID=182803 RepID=A0A4Y2QVW0_ARAVE|nr:hypothetical protein AVEN_49030-1 [Araneus ventricosus]GBN67563.1 hypothetical protein AVEN_267494-1 [Araneus ventricosus]
MLRKMLLSFFSKHRKFRFTRDVYNVSRCIVDIDVHKRREEHCSRSRIDDRKRAAFPRSSVITVVYLSPCFFHRDSSSRDIRCEVRIVVLTR